MKPEQRAALKKLEAALRGCGAVGVCLIGMGDTLCAFDREALRATGWGKSSVDSIEAMTELGQGVDVRHSGAYLDSGGW